MFELRRPVAASNRMTLNFFVLLGTGVYLIWSELKMPAPNPIWYVLGAVFLLWAAFVMFNILRPLRLRLAADGVFAQGPFGSHSFAWDALKWVDFTRPNAAAVLSYIRAGSQKEGIVILSRKTTTEMERTDVLRIILENRPDVATNNPQPFVTLFKDVPA